MSKKRCLYCGKVMNEVKNYCNDECRENYDKFEKYANKNTKKFILAIVVALLCAFVGMIMSAYYTKVGVAIMSISILFMFITMLIFPFATPETIKLMGVKRSIITVRVIVVIVIVFIVISNFI